MDILVCLKRVPASGGAPQLTADGTAVDTRHLAFTVGPHEECAIEEAVQITERAGGEVTAVSAGPPEADEQLRFAVSMGAHRALLAELDGDPDPQAVAAALIETIRRDEAGRGRPYDLMLFGDESPDAGHHQVGVRIAVGLDRPFLGGVAGIEAGDAPAEGLLRVRRATPAGSETYHVPIPAALAVKEGLNLPRYPSMRGRLRARKADVETVRPAAPQGGLQSRRLRIPEGERRETVVLGHGAAAAPAVVDLLEELELLQRGG